MSWFNPTFLRQELRIVLESLVLKQATPAAIKPWLLDLALNLDQGNWFGSLWQRPNYLSRVGFQIGLKYQVNHLGNVFNLTNDARSVTQKIEFQVIEYLKNQLHSPKSIQGYCASGGTESNLYLMWLAKNWFAKTPQTPPVVLVTDLTHYSATKAARIVGLKTVKVALDEVELTMSPAGLELQLEKLVKAGQRAFALVLTWGYSSTGGCDNWQKIEPTLKAWGSKYPDIRFFVWIDASAQGLPLLYLSKLHAEPFKSKLIQGYVIDYHKLGLTPLQTGVVLYQAKLAKLITQPISYLAELDSTISGSRMGASAISIWLGNQSVSIGKWRKYYSKLILAKNNWLKLMLNKHPNLEIITHPEVLTAALIVSKAFPRLSKATESFYGLKLIEAEVQINSGLGVKTKRLRYYKVHFLNFNLPIL